MSPEALIAKNLMEKWDQFIPQERRAEFYNDVVGMHISIMESAVNKMALALGQKPVDLSSDR